MCAACTSFVLAVVWQMQLVKVEHFSRKDRDARNSFELIFIHRGLFFCVLKSIELAADGKVVASRGQSKKRENLFTEIRVYLKLERE